MGDAAPARSLPRGRHRLSRDQITDDQRLRILLGMAEAMGEAGYVGTSVADVIARAGVSRQTFYVLFDDKLAACLSAFDAMAGVVLDRLRRELDGAGEPIERLERAVHAYLDTLAGELGYARLFLVEVHAAGPAALARRARVQDQIVDAMVELLDVHDEGERFGVRVLVAAVSSMITGPIVDRDPDALRALGQPIVDHVRRLAAAGVLGGRP